MNLKNKIIIWKLFLLSLSVAIAQPGSAQPSWTLEQCLQYAASHNKDLIISRRQIRLATIEASQAKAKLLPTITGSASLDHYWQIPVQVFPGELVGQPQGTFIPVRLGTPWMGNAGLQADLSLIDAAAWKQIKTRMLGRQLKAAQNFSEQKLIVKNVRMAYYSAILNDEDYHTAVARLEDFKESHRLITLNFEKGITDQIAVNQSLSLLEELSDDVSRSKATHQQSLLDLKFWMGFPLADSIQLTGGNIPLPEKIPDETFKAALTPDFAADSLMVEIARSSLDQSRAALYPKLSVVSGYSKLGFGSEASFITRSNWFSSGYVGLRLSIPVFDMPRMHYQLKKDKQSAGLAMAERDASVSDGKKAFLSASVAYSRAMQELGSLRKKEALAEDNVRLSTKKLEKGVIDMIELKQLQDELTLTRRRRLTAQLQGLIQMVELEYLQGN
ncbi:TolC family protein [Dyadobacter sp. MSC1_007]|jgi:outer membrane protein|uniref:TolC family protein n=1 Tax=Dyadobacter sp. MSC1_007 TaxID=2909264 RepID=UPI00202FB3CE|nr:TolC family protein [Dyadobacter sp. MSC1_007]